MSKRSALTSGSTRRISRNDSTQQRVLGERLGREFSRPQPRRGNTGKPRTEVRGRRRSMTESRTDGTEFVGGTCPLRLGNACYCSKRLNSFVGAPAKTAVLLLAHCSPENPDQIPEFLSYVTGGRPLPPAVVEEILPPYSLLPFSTLACLTLFNDVQLSQSLQMPVFVGMRNWKPFIAHAGEAIVVHRYEN